MPTRHSGLSSSLSQNFLSPVRKSKLFSFLAPLGPRVITRIACNMASPLAVIALFTCPSLLHLDGMKGRLINGKKRRGKERNGGRGVPWLNRPEAQVQPRTRDGEEEEPEMLEKESVDCVYIPASAKSEIIIWSYQRKYLIRMSYIEGKKNIISL